LPRTSCGAEETAYNIERGHFRKIFIILGAFHMANLIMTAKKFFGFQYTYVLLSFIITIFGFFILAPCFASDSGSIALDILGNSEIRRDFADMATFEQRENARAVKIISIALVFIIGIILLIIKIIKKLKFRAGYNAVNLQKYAHAYPDKKRGWAIVLWFLGLFGFFGLHSFYLGRKKAGLFKLAAFLFSFLIIPIVFRGLGAGDVRFLIMFLGLCVIFIWNIVDLVKIIWLPKVAFEAKPPDSSSATVVEIEPQA
jgi:hypothetical protein